MKTVMKTSIVGALALAMATLGTTNAQAWGAWPIAAAAVGGLAVGTTVGAAVASANAPTYAYPDAYPAYPAAPAYSTTYPAGVPISQQTYAPGPTTDARATGAAGGAAADCGLRGVSAGLSVSELGGLWRGICLWKSRGAGRLGLGLVGWTLGLPRLGRARRLGWPRRVGRPWWLAPLSD